MAGFIFKGFAIFWGIWLLWYVTGGPLRDDKNKPFVGFYETGEIQHVGTTTKK